MHMDSPITPEISDIPCSGHKTQCLVMDYDMQLLLWWKAYLTLCVHVNHFVCRNDDSIGFHDHRCGNVQQLVPLPAWFVHVNLMNGLHNTLYMP